jgi:hypothetical protein
LAGFVALRAMNLMTPEVRSQIEEITRRAGHIWRYL